MKPYLLMDVDGVLNAMGEYEVDLPHYHRVACDNEDGYVYLHEDLGEWMQALQTQYELVWCTTWESSANTTLAPLLGILDCEVVPMVDLVYSLDHHWKQRTVATYLRDHPRPAVWLDDEFRHGDTAWAASLQPPLKLVHCGANAGLTHKQVSMLLSPFFRRGLNGEEGDPIGYYSTNFDEQPASLPVYLTLEPVNDHPPHTDAACWRYHVDCGDHSEQLHIPDITIPVEENCVPVTNELHPPCSDEDLTEFIDMYLEQGIL